MKIIHWKTLCGLVLFGLVSAGAQAAQVNVFAKATFLGTYAVELEISDFADADSVDLVHPDLGTFPLAFDSGESNWDVEAEDLSLSDLGAFFDTTFQLVIDLSSGGQSIYEGARVGPPGAGDFPTPALSLSVVPSSSPERPTASWIGGDGSAGQMIITYASADDEFTNGFETAEANSSRDLNQDLAIGVYDVSLGFYNFLDPAALTLLTGDDVLATNQLNLANVGETFTGYTVVPLPGALWLLLSGLGSLVIARGRRRD
jgi:hypothetical protein